MNPGVDNIIASIRRSAQTSEALAEQAVPIHALTRAIVAALEAGGKVMTAGHGGSAAQALHMAEELVGRFERDRPPLPAIALVADPTLLTCITNDYGFPTLFPRQVEALGRPGDVLVVFSTSGNGEGLRQALQMARDRGLVTVALLGKTGGVVRGLAEHELIIPSDETARIQEAHMLIMHVILEAVDRRFAGEQE